MISWLAAFADVPAEVARHQELVYCITDRDPFVD